MISIFPISNGSQIISNEDFVEKILPALSEYFPLNNDDVLVVSSLAISLAQGNVVSYKNLTEKNAIIEGESKRIIRSRPDIKISETIHGFICEDAGVQKKYKSDNELVLLPIDIDKAAHSVRLGLKNQTGYDCPVIVSGNFHRPFRLGEVGVALGISGLNALNENGITCDSIASAAELTMDYSNNIYCTLVRGMPISYKGNSKGKDIIRPIIEELFL